MSKKPNIENVTVIEDKSGGQKISFSENNMYIEPTRDAAEVIFWKERLETQGIPYVLASVDYSTKDVDATGKTINKTRRGKTLFTGEVPDKDANATRPN